MNSDREIPASGASSSVDIVDQRGDMAKDLEVHQWYISTDRPGAYWKDDGCVEMPEGT